MIVPIFHVLTDICQETGHPWAFIKQKVLHRKEYLSSQIPGFVFFFFHIRKTVIEQLSASSQVRQVHPPWVR